MILMDMQETKRTVPVPSAPTDGEQPISKTPAYSIADNTVENNHSEKSLEEMQRESDPAYLHTISMTELYENIYKSRPPIIDGLLYPGTYLFIRKKEQAIMRCWM